MSEQTANKYLEQIRNIDDWGDTVPWSPGHELSLRANGGAHLRDDTRVTVVEGMYSSFVKDDRTVQITGDRHVEIKDKLLSSIETVDTLTVNGSTKIKAHDRLVIGLGNVDRKWTGPMLRMAGMEGVIAGGIFCKTFAALSITMSPLATGDVYGGALHSAGLRLRIAGKFSYQSAERAANVGGLLVRNNAITLEPIIGTAALNPPRHWGKKLARIGLGLFPPGDILLGVAMLPFAIAMGIYSIAKNWNTPPPPPTGPPRVHNRSYGTKIEARSMEKIL